MSAKITNTPNMEVLNWGTDNIHIDSWTFKMRPTKFHFKVNGTVTDEPSIAIEMQTPAGGAVIGEMSIQTLKECLGAIGYTLTKT